MPANVPTKLDVNFENKIRLLGFKAEPEIARPGADIKITYYWKCEDSVDEGWRLFTHVQDDASDHPIGNLDGEGPLRKIQGDKPVLGPDRWEKGKYYVDEQTYHVPDDVTGETISFYVGVWKGESRLRVLTGPNDGSNRAIAGKLKTGLSSAKAPPAPPPEPAIPRLMVRKTTDKITIDGVADEKVWATAASTGPLVDVGTGRLNSSFPVSGSVKLLWDDTHVYAFFSVKSSQFYMGFTDAKAQPADFTAAGQPKLWTKDTVEWMIDPDGDGDNKDYYELQFGPQTTKVFKSQFDTLQQPNGGPNGPFGHEDWDPKLKSVALVTKGPDGKPDGYSVEVAIPWAGFTKGNGKAPKPTDSWRMNFYAMKENSGVAWSPILGKGNFHHAPRFGRVMFVTPAPVASASASAPVAPPPPKPRP
ncbi:MAG: carbohydrate-binding family 9-like protein [Myxococcales bacterium]